MQKEILSNCMINILKLAKEASSSGDRIQAEYYYQFADHYSFRLMNGIKTYARKVNTENSTESIDSEQ